MGPKALGTQLKTCQEELQSTTWTSMDVLKKDDPLALCV